MELREVTQDMVHGNIVERRYNAQRTILIFFIFHDGMLVYGVLTTYSQEWSSFCARFVRFTYFKTLCEMDLDIFLL